MSATEYQERHQDYVFSAPDLASGQQAQALVFQIDPDYPFELRGLAARVPYNAAGQQVGLEYLLMRWTDGDGNYQQQGLTLLSFLLGPYFGQLGAPKPVSPAVRFEKSAIITLDLFNGGPNPITGLQLFFRGVKLLPKGVGASAYTYPGKMVSAPLSFVYPLIVPNLQVTDSLDGLFNPQNDSDFVLRYGQAGQGSPANVPTALEVFITLKDEGGKPFSNAPVHMDVLFGRSDFQAAYPCGLGYVAPVGPGAAQPGLLYPEIYMPRNHQLLYTITRNDAAYPGLGAVDYPLLFGGMKVFPG